MAFLFAGYSFDPDTGLGFGGRSIQLPPKERELLHFLLRSQGKIVSKDDVVREIWHGGTASDESISRVVYRLRLAMQAAGGPPVVTTVYNGGYRLSAPIQQQNDTAGSSIAALLQSRLAGVLLPMIMSGREFAARQTRQDLAVALRAAQAAAEMDPEYTSAWVALAELHMLQAMRSVLPAQQAGSLAKQAAEKALSINAECGPGLAVRGWVRALIDGDLYNGLDDLDRALRVDAQYWGTYLLRSSVLQALQNHDAAVEMAKRVQQLNSYSLIASASLPLQLMYAGRLAEAHSSAQQMVALFPNVDNVQEAMSIILCAQNQFEEALGYAQRCADLAIDTPTMHAQLAYTLVKLGRNKAAREVLQTIEASELSEPFAAVAPVYLALGEPRTAIAKLRMAKLNGVPLFYAMRNDPRLTELGSSLEFKNLWV